MRFFSRNTFSILFLLFLLIHYIHAPSFITVSQTDFNAGTYTRSFYNTTSSTLMLNLSFNNGSYLSQVFDSGGATNWSNISWVTQECENCDLPNNNGSEDASIYVTRPNMTGNTFLVHFNESSGSIVDWSPNSKNGTANGGPTYAATGQFGNAISFDGTGDFFNTGSAISNFFPNNAKTFSVWIRPTGPSLEGPFAYRGQGVIGDNDGYVGIFRTSISGTDNVWAYNWDGNEDRTGIAYETNTWTHVVMTHDGTNIYLFKNGTFISSVASGSTSSMAGSLTVGRANGFNGNFDFNGTIDEMAVWNRNLTAAEIQHLYRRGVARLNISVRTCTTSDCSDQSGFSQTFNTSPSNLSLSRRYGQYNVSFRTDDVGYATHLYNVTLNYTEGDRTPPGITVQQPANNSNFSSTSVTLNYNISAGPANTCWYSLNNGTSNSSIASCANTTITAGGGLSYLTIYANDSENNVNSSGQLRVNVDLIPPSLTVELPINNSNYSSNSVVLNYTTLENLTAVNSCWYTINNGATNTSIASCANTTISPGGGRHNITVYVNDSVNNVNNTISNISIRVDLTAPVVSVFIPSETMNYNDTNISLNFTVTENVTSINSCWYNLDNTDNVSIASCNNLSIISTEGTHVIVIYSNDSVNNIGNGSRINFTILLPTTASSSSSGTSPKLLTVRIEGKDDPINQITFAACTDDYIEFTADPPIEDVSARLILYEPFEGLRQQAVTTLDGKVVFDMTNEKEGIYLLDMYVSGYVKPSDIYFKFIHCSNGKLANTQEKEDALAALLKAQDAIRIAKEEKRETRDAEGKLYDAQKAFDQGHYEEAINLAREAEKLALFGKPKEIIVIEKEVVVENDTIVVVDKEEIPVEIPLEEVPVEIPAKPRKKLGSYVVSTEVYEDATVISITFTPEDEFEGTLRSKLDTDYNYYLDGTIDINSPTHGRPSEVAKGSILAYWHNVALKSQEKFIAEYTAKTELSSEEILSASMNFVKQDDLPLRVSEENEPDAPVTEAPIKTETSLFLYGVIIVLFVLVIALAAFILRKRK